LGTPPRSSFGARLRRRVPQYGHSVMYGETSEPQLLQMTKRSGPLAMGFRFYAPLGATEGFSAASRHAGYNLFKR
jgi:hypothetical protein